MSSSTVEGQSRPPTEARAAAAKASRRVGEEEGHRLGQRGGDRDEKRLGARALGVPVELHFLDVPFDELCRRLARRDHEPQPGSVTITPKLLIGYTGFFQAPDRAELDLFDPSTLL